MLNVSVIIPCYNRAGIIAETISNMLNQDLKPYEIIVVDDGSTDNSVDIISSFGDQVRLIRQSNYGPGAARNAGLRVATGDYIQFMDSDDLVSLDKLRIQAVKLEETGADLVYGPWVKAWITSGRIRPENVVLQQKALPVSRSPLLWFLTEWSMVFQQCLVRKTMLDKTGIFNESMRFYEDGELFVRLLLSGAKIIHEELSLTFYRLDDYGKLTQSGQKNDQRIKDEFCFFDQIYKLLQNNSEYNSILSHPDFRIRVWKSLKEYKNPGTAFEYKNIPVKGWNKMYILLHLYNRICAGLRARIKGYRWPSCFQAGTLSQHNKEQIKEMGWNLFETI
jgi:glycosyltransferase involved in cell wall biosynthesis